METNTPHSTEIPKGLEVKQQGKDLRITINESNLTNALLHMMGVIVIFLVLTAWSPLPKLVQDLNATDFFLYAVSLGYLVVSFSLMLRALLRKTTLQLSGNLIKIHHGGLFHWKSKTLSIEELEQVEIKRFPIHQETSNPVAAVRDYIKEELRFTTTSGIVKLGASTSSKVRKHVFEIVQNFISQPQYA